MAAILRVNHVNVTVPMGKEKECQEFYEGILGLKRADRPAEITGPGLWYDFDADNQLHISFSEHPRSEQLSDHFAVEVDDMAGFIERLHRHGIETRGPNQMQYDNSERLFFRDPFGNHIELVHYKR
jgi:catechol 2,3-dioxygenase-like lactoylglutathione lyase family enzyme